MGGHGDAPGRARAARTAPSPGCSWTPRPGAPPGIDPDIVAFGVAIVQAEGMAALRAAQDELDLLGSPAYQRVLRERPGFREYADRKWASLSPVMWATLAVEITSQPDQSAELAAAAAAQRPPTLVIVGEQDTPFLPGSRAIARRDPRRAPRRHPRRRPLPAVREPRRRGARSMREFLDAPRRDEVARGRALVARGLVDEPRALDDDARDAARRRRARGRR